MNQGKLQEAETIYRDLIAAGMNSHLVYGNLAAICGMQGKLNELIDLLKKALELKPNYQIAHNNLGLALKDQGDLTAAIASFNTALELNPNDPIAHYNLGIALKAQGDLSAAIISYNKALSLKPNYPEAHYNLGNALKDQGDLTAAIASYNKTIELNPNDPLAHNNLGAALEQQGDITAAVASYNKAIELNPNDPDAHGNLAHTLLLLGDYKKGWEEYEWRSTKKKNPSLPHSNPSCARFVDVKLNINNQLLLVSEQGLGDTLQFMRYALELKRQGIAVSLCAEPKLHSLIKASGIVSSPLTPEQANKITAGNWLPLLSLPRHLEVSPEKPIINEPYIKTTDTLLKKWGSILSREQRPIIGINWQGNPKVETQSFKGRSLNLETFNSITENHHASLISLQKGFGSEQLDTCSFKNRFVSCQDQVNDTWDFLETAAIIANCDLVITSDTSVAHLAGGMGKTAWLLLKKIPDWRWGLEGERTFWYPSIRLFRQKEHGNWDEVMTRLAKELKKLFGVSSTALQLKDETPAPKQRKVQSITVPISLGELIDKITILQIKTQHLQGAALENVKTELDALEASLNNLNLNMNPTLIQPLQEINQDLWQIEDAIRDQERQKNFEETFIRLARSVYQKNDQRSKIKKNINTAYGSALVEEKSYEQY